MELSEREIEFLTKNTAAAMITVDAHGVAKAARVAIALIDGHIWSSGTGGRVRTTRLRRDPRCTLYVPEDGFGFLCLETTVTLLEGSGSIDQSVRLFRQTLNTPTGPLFFWDTELDEQAFRQRLVEDERLIYQFEVQRSYGL